MGLLLVSCTMTDSERCSRNYHAAVP